ncbi:MAG: VIT domain-containing protein [Candidatus Micrarchaeota archaeon]
MKLGNIVLAVLLVFLFSAGVARADGFIMPPHPDEPYPLILNHYVTIDISGEYAVTHVEQEFKNDGYRDIEGTYVFPVPAGGVRDFALVVDGKVYEGRMLGKEDAKRIYQEYAVARKEASLLEYVGRDMFQSSVVLPRGKTVRVQITYEQIIPESGGVSSLMYPLSTERYTTKPIDPVDIKVNLTVSGKLGFIISPTHNVTVTRSGEGSARITYYSKEIPDKDFQLYYGITEREYDVKVLASKRENEGYFMLFVYPSLADAPASPKDIVFVIDTSYSMYGTKLEQAKKALTYSLEHLGENDKFNIISFSTTTRAFSSTLKDAASVESGKAFVNDLEAEGATNIYDPLLEAVGQFSDNGRPHIIVLLTDGEDTTGHTRDMIVNELKKKGGSWKIFPFGVGADIDFELLDKLANDFGDGIPTYIRTDAELETTLTSFYNRISRPLLTDVSLTIERGWVFQFADTHLVAYDIYPKKSPDIFFGTQLLFAGGYNGSGSANVILTGKLAGVEKRFVYEVNFPSEGSNYFVERTWALRKVGFLLDQIALEGETPELKEEVTALANRYGIPSPYTSYIVTSEKGEIMQRNIPLADATGGWGAPAAESYIAGAMYKQVGSEGGGTYHAGETKTIADKTFVSVDGVWKDASCATHTPTQTVGFGSSDYLALTNNEQTAQYLSAGESVFVCPDPSTAIRVTPALAGASTTPPTTQPPTTQPPTQPPSTPPTEPTPSRSWLFILLPGVFIALLAIFIVFIITRPKAHAPEEEEEHPAETYKALSSSTRLGILSELQEGDRTPTDLSARLRKSKATIVEHLDKLVDARMVEKVERDGRKWVFYKLTSKGKSAIRKGG